MRREGINSDLTWGAILSGDFACVCVLLDCGVVCVALALCSLLVHFEYFGNFESKHESKHESKKRKKRKIQLFGSSVA